MSDKECKGFHWIGQRWSSCDNCGRPWQEHEGLHTLRRDAGPLDTGENDWYIKPWSEVDYGSGGREMSGEFFDPTPQPIHQCKLPDVDKASVRMELKGWRCECGKAYERYMESQHGESWWQWRRAPKFDQKEVKSE